MHLWKTSCLSVLFLAQCALWPMWSCGVVQGSLRLSGGGLMVCCLSLCACYGCVCVRHVCMPVARLLSLWVILSHCVVEGWCLIWQIIHHAVVVTPYWVCCCTIGSLFSFCIIALTTFMPWSWLASHCSMMKCYLRELRDFSFPYIDRNGLCRGIKQLNRIQPDKSSWSSVKNTQGHRLTFVLVRCSSE